MENVNLLYCIPLCHLLTLLLHQEGYWREVVCCCLIKKQTKETMFGQGFLRFCFRLNFWNVFSNICLSFQGIYEVFIGGANQSKAWLHPQQEPRNSNISSITVILSPWRKPLPFPAVFCGRKLSTTCVKWSLLLNSCRCCRSEHSRQPHEVAVGCGSVWKSGGVAYGCAVPCWEGWLDVGMSVHVRSS